MSFLRLVCFVYAASLQTSVAKTYRASGADALTSDIKSQVGTICEHLVFYELTAFTSAHTWKPSFSF